MDENKVYVIKGTLDLIEGITKEEFDAKFPIAVEDGGTGATTAAGARDNLLAGMFLTKEFVNSGSYTLEPDETMFFGSSSIAISGYIPIAIIRKGVFNDNVDITEVYSIDILDRIKSNSTSVIKVTNYTTQVSFDAVKHTILYIKSSYLAEAE